MILQLAELSMKLHPTDFVVIQTEWSDGVPLTEYAALRCAILELNLDDLAQKSLPQSL